MSADCDVGSHFYIHSTDQNYHINLSISDPCCFVIALVLLKIRFTFEGMTSVVAQLQIHGIQSMYARSYTVYHWTNIHMKYLCEQNKIHYNKPSFFFMIIYGNSKLIGELDDPMKRKTIRFDNNVLKTIFMNSFFVFCIFYNMVFWNYF